MKKQYISPICNIVEINQNDIIATSTFSTSGTLGVWGYRGGFYDTIEDATNSGDVTIIW